jgi:DNA-binding response OmpR family regulator
MLREMGHASHSVENADEALPFMNSWWPDLILTNYDLGDSNAVQLCGEVKDLFGESPAVLIHCPKIEHRFLGRQYPEASFVNSPVSLEELRSRLRSIQESLRFEWDAVG